MTNAQELELNLKMTPDQALMLVTNSALNFIPEQTERFEVLASTKNPLDPEFRDGIVFFCDTASDAVLLMSFENASGYDASVLWDLAGEDYAVLSSRSFASYQNEVFPNLVNARLLNQFKAN
jgi:hypothetical protein